MFPETIVLFAAAAPFVQAFAVIMCVAVFLVFIACLLSMSVPYGDAPRCETCGEPLEEGRDMDLEDEWR